MSQTYYRIERNMDRHGWFLDEPVDADGEPLDARAFTCGVPFKRPSTRLVIPIDVPGPALDFTLGAFDMPVVSESIGALLERHAHGASQRVPASISGSKCPYEILNVLSAVRCLNEEKSVLKWWTEADGRPEKVGAYSRVSPDMVLHADRIGDQKIFRIEGWMIALIVTEEIKVALEQVGVTGIKFRRLCTT